MYVHVCMSAFGRPPDDVQHDRAPLVRGRDVEEDQLVRVLLVVGDGCRHGIAGVRQVDEPDALDDAAVLDVEAGDDALGQHPARPHAGTAAWAARRSSLPSYSARPTIAPTTPGIAA